MTESPFTIVHATDLRPDGGAAFEHSVAMARSAGARLFTVHASTPSDARDRRDMPDARALLHEWGDHTPLEFTAMEHECCLDPVDTLLDAVRRIEPHLLVVGTHRRTTLERLLYDSVSNALAVNATVPTLFVPIDEPGLVGSDGELRVHRIVIPVGSHADFQVALPAASMLADRLGLQNLEFHFLHVGLAGSLDDELAPEHPGWSYHFETVEGELQPAIARFCDEHDIDLIVMATRGQDGFLDVLRGTHTQQALRAANCPLLVVPIDTHGSDSLPAE